jgi:predicted amidohydrolase
MRVALIQLDTAWEHKPANLKRAEELIANAAEQGCDLAVLPEMFSTGFSMNVKDIAEDEDGPTASFLSGAAKKHSINIIGGFSAKGTDAKGRNVAHAYGREGELLASYAKMHPFCLAGEDKHYEAGDSPVVFELDGTPSSMFICYDLRFPEAMRAIARKVKVLFFIANWPAERAEHWSALLRARAIENQCFVVGANRIGTDPNGLEYSGGSAIYGPEGRKICSASATCQIHVCEFDPAGADAVRSELPFLDDMRP